jgi:hypothetical protein
MPPNVEPFVVPRANRLMDAQNPLGVAQGLATFLDRHVAARG